MAPMNRRDICLSAGAFAVLGLLADAQAQHASADTIDMAKSHVFHFDRLAVEQNANGGWQRPVMHGTLPTGEFVEVHESMLPPGQMPHPPHKHRNTEFVLMREGHVEYLDENGKQIPMGPGDIAYSASNQMHGMKNTGTANATYFIVSVSHGQL